MPESVFVGMSIAREFQQLNYDRPVSRAPRWLVEQLNSWIERHIQFTTELQRSSAGLEDAVQRRLAALFESRFQTRVGRAPQPETFEVDRSVPTYMAPPPGNEGYSEDEGGYASAEEGLLTDDEPAAEEEEEDEGEGMPSAQQTSGERSGSRNAAFVQASAALLSRLSGAYSAPGSGPVAPADPRARAAEAMHLLEDEIVSVVLQAERDRRREELESLRSMSTGRQTDAVAQMLRVRAGHAQPAAVPAPDHVVSELRVLRGSGRVSGLSQDFRQGLEQLYMGQTGGGRRGGSLSSSLAPGRRVPTPAASEEADDEAGPVLVGRDLLNAFLAPAATVERGTRRAHHGPRHGPEGQGFTDQLLPPRQHFSRFAMEEMLAMEIQELQQQRAVQSVLENPARRQPLESLVNRAGRNSGRAGGPERERGARTRQQHAPEAAAPRQAQPRHDHDHQHQHQPFQVAVAAPSGGGRQLREVQSEMQNMSQQVAELTRLVSMSLEMQFDIQRAMRQEVAALVYQYNQVDASSKAPLPSPSQSTKVTAGVCVICMANEVDCVFYRCGHMAACSGCSKTLMERDQPCPLCRAPINDVIRVYRPVGNMP